MGERRCSCCTLVVDERVGGAEFDSRFLCLHCQPCPMCGEFGTDCDDWNCYPRPGARPSIPEPTEDEKHEVR